MKKFLNLLIGVVIFLVVFVLLANIIPAADAVGANSYDMKYDLQIVTDIDDGSVLPADTMFAFNSASSFGCMRFRISLVYTYDDVPIVAAVDDLAEYTLSRGRISEHIYPEIYKLNFAYNYTTDGGETYPLRNQMHSCVTLNDLLDSYPYSYFIIDIVPSEDDAKHAWDLCEIIRERGMERDVIITGSEETIMTVRENPNVHIMTTPLPGELRSFRLMSAVFLSNLVNNLDYAYIEIPIEDLDDYSLRMLAELRRRNVAIYVTGVDSEEDFMTVKDMNISGIITADPRLIFELKAITDDDLPE